MPSAFQQKAEEPGFFGPRHHGRGGVFMPWRMFRQLNLEDHQREEIRTVFEQESGLLRELRQSVFEARKALQETALADGDVMTAATTLAGAEAEMARAQARLHKHLDAVLTAEQKAKLEELRAEAEKLREERLVRRKERMQKLREEGPPQPRQDW
jgi:Spy/CpxP family protein refolding chaperone